MSTETEKLQAFALASVKMHVSTQHALAVLRNQVKLIKNQLAILNPDHDLQAAHEQFEVLAEQAFKDIDARTDAMLTALENVVRG